MKCPQCSANMRSIRYENVNVQTCDKCGGEFVGPAEMATIVKTREAAFGKNLKQLVQDHKPIFGIPAGESDRTLKCPGCSGSMRLINYATDSGVTVDRCQDCGGMWLDHDELEKIQVIMEQWQEKAPGKLMAIAGQLEQARMKTAQQTSKSFAGSRFSFVNALINRLLDAA
ncbi:MAG: zf-TFIIB domain-containing protein [Phycisphaerales bacterium]|nr:zf-TFIIB domain-containing protein [Phycisphaerales bacterium]